MYKPKDGGSLAYAGTCFQVQVAINVPDKAVNYLVTASHVITEIERRGADGLVYIRVNRKNGEIVHVQSLASMWRRHPTDPLVDVAACPWQPHDLDETTSPPKPVKAEMDTIPVGTNLFATPERLKSEGVGVGDDVVCIGLFSRFVGTAKNLPIVRAGQIALLPDEPVPTKYFGNMEAFLIEVRSVGGLSGSPIFLYSTPPRMVTVNDIRHQPIFMMLGMIHGHWDTPDTPMQAAVPAMERLNVGIAIGIPAHKILEVLDHPDFVKVRSEIETKGTGSLRATPGEYILEDGSRFRQ